VDKEERNTDTPSNRKITLLIIFTAIGSVISGAALLPSYNLSQVAAQQAGSNAQLSLSMLRQHGAPLLGSPSARITIIEFGDFQCPFCARFAKETEPQINQTYIQTGKVNMVFVQTGKVNLVLIQLPLLWQPSVLTIKESSGIFTIYYTRIRVLKTRAGLVKTIRRNLHYKHLA
jgi:hypothetical protein